MFLCDYLVFVARGSHVKCSLKCTRRVIFARQSKVHDDVGSIGGVGEILNLCMHFMYFRFKNRAR